MLRTTPRKIITSSRKAGIALALANMAVIWFFIVWFFIDLPGYHHVNSYGFTVSRK